MNTSPESNASKKSYTRIHLLESDDVLRAWIRGDAGPVKRTRDRQVLCENSRYADFIGARWMSAGNGRGCWHEHYEA